MGKGDKKSKRGKIIMGSHGKKRPRKSKPVAKIIENPATAKKSVPHPVEKPKPVKAEKIEEVVMHDVIEIPVREEKSEVKKSVKPKKESEPKTEKKPVEKKAKKEKTQE